MKTSSRTALVVAAMMTFGLFGLAFSATPAAAQNQTITLYGSRAGGWGLTNTSLTTPGPHLQIVQATNVTLVLTSADQFTHDWFIDYDVDSSLDGNEPGHPGTFGSVTEFSNFTTDQNGTFIYRSAGSSDGPRMWGLITILPPGSSLPGAGGLTDITTLAIVVAAVAVIAILVLAMRFGLFGGKKRGPRAPPRTPPPPPEE